MKTPLYTHTQSSQILQRRQKNTASQPIKPDYKNCRYPVQHLLGLLIIVVLSLAAVTTAYAKDPRELVVGVRIDAPPFSFCAVAPSEESVTGDEEVSCLEVPDISTENSEAGRKYQGYTVDLCKRIIKRAVEEEGLYCREKYKEITSADRFELLKNNEIDLLCGATTVTLERLRVADFSLYTFLSGASLMYTQSKPDNKKPKNSLNVGVLEKTTTREQVRDIISNMQQHEDNFKPIILQNIEITSYSNHYAGLYGLLDEEIDAYIADREILLALKTQGEQILEARNKVRQSIGYVIFSDEEENEKQNEYNFGVLDTIAEEQTKQIIDDVKKHEGDIDKLLPEEGQKYSNYRDGLKALENKEISAFIADNGIFKALQKRVVESVEAQTEDEIIKHTVNMKILLVTEKEEDLENDNNDKEKKDPEDDNDDKEKTNQTDMKLIVLGEYFTVEPYAIGIRLGATDLRYVADKVLNEMFAWNPASGTSEIYTILQRSFPGKKFSKSIENMFRLQRVSVGKRVADEFLPRIPRSECKEQKNNNINAEGTQLATSP